LTGFGLGVKSRKRNEGRVKVFYFRLGRLSIESLARAKSEVPIGSRAILTRFGGMNKQS